jgi:phosphoribosylanthranilate isomerase
MSVRVKTCGITNREDALAAIEAGADALGFNFYGRSPRYVAPELAREICSHVPEAVCRVGIFVNAGREDVASVVRRVGLTAVQFHGDETPDDCRGWSCKVVKALRVSDKTAVTAARAYDVDYILADAHVEGAFGGSGKRVDLALLEELDPERLIVAGGLTPDNVAEVVRRLRPFGVDVASGIERSPGKKDWERMRRFIANANAA